MTRRPALVSVVVLSVVLAGWVFVNPGGQFGVCRFGVTTYNRIPVPVLDVQVRADGAIRVVFKTHSIDAQRLAWLLSGRPPEVLVVGIGWDSGAELASQAKTPHKASRRLNA